jgi:hypothetical protein
MQPDLKRKLVIGATTIAVAAFAGGAYAATQESSTSPQQAFLNDVAKRLNVTPQTLRSAMQGAFLDQLNAAVAAGKLTQSQADAIKQRLQKSGALPLGGLRALVPGPWFGRPFGLGPLVFGGLGSAAKYLGLTNAQLLSQLQSGKSLAQIAAGQGKSTAGLKDAITAAEKAMLDKAVAAKELTSTQEQELLSRLSLRLDKVISRAGLAPRMGLHWLHGMRHGLIAPGPGGPSPMPVPAPQFPAAPAPPPGFAPA